MSSSEVAMSMSSFLTEEIMGNMLKVAEELASRVTDVLYKHQEEYGYDVDVLLREIGLPSGKSASVSSRSKPNRQVAAKASTTESAIRIPYSGECNEDGCHGLRFNAGLYTQCKLVAKANNLCKTCQNSADRNSGIPEYGTTDMRKEQDMFSYVDPKGRKQVAYSKVMSKENYTKEQVLEEAGKQGITINERPVSYTHLTLPTKRIV